MGQEEYKSPKVYFQEQEDNNINTAVVDKTTMKEKVKLSLSLEQCLPSTSYKIKITFTNNDKHECFETEKNKPNPDNIINFETTFLMTYYFEREQIILFDVEINNETIQYKTTLGCIVGSRNSTLNRKISKERNEQIKVKSTKVDSSNKKLKINFRISKENLNKNSFSKNKFYFLIKSDRDLYRSELISNDGFFKTVIIPVQYLTPSFTVTFYNLRKEVLIDFPNFTIEKALADKEILNPFESLSKLEFFVLFCIISKFSIFI